MTRPQALALDRVPRDLRPLPVWLLWRSTPNGDAKPKKIPFYSDGDRRSGKLDTRADRKRLVTFDVALRKFNARNYTGLGVALGPVPETELILSGIDLDNCRRDQVIAPLAREVIAAGNGAYTEVSPSGTGVKIFGTGDIGTEKSAELEIYSGKRFFAITGQHEHGDRLTDLTPAATLARRLLLQHEAGKQGIAQGARNNTLFRFACTLRARNVPDADAWITLQSRNADCLPPLLDHELRQTMASAWKHPPGFACTDLGNAERLVAAHGDDVRYLVGAEWHLWQGHRFEADRTRQVTTLMGDVVRGIYTEAAAAADSEQRKSLGGWAKASESRGRIESAIALASSRPEVVDLFEHFDSDPWLVGLRNGVYDLQRDEFRPGRREDRITLCMNVEFDSRTSCKRWEQFQLEIHADDADMVAFKQRALGYSLCGDTSEQKLFICYGSGANGKSTEQSVMLDLVGGYGRKVEPDTLLIKDRRGSANNDIARLKGARLIVTAESEDGQRLAEALVKTLTGEDRITARFMYEEYFEFQFTGKIWLATNHRPEVTGTDYALWRRMLLVPYEVKFDEGHRDPQLRPKLLAERPGVFNWLLAGFRQWRQKGLAPPAKVLAATDQYREDMDRIKAFLTDCCVRGTGATRASDVYRRYQAWTRGSGTYPLAARKFHERMERDHGHRRVHRQTDVYPNLMLIAWEFNDDPG